MRYRSSGVQLRAKQLIGLVRTIFRAKIRSLLMEGASVTQSELAYVAALPEIYDAETSSRWNLRRNEASQNIRTLASQARILASLPENEQVADEEVIDVGASNEGELDEEQANEVGSPQEIEMTEWSGGESQGDSQENSDEENSEDNTDSDEG